MSTSQTGSTAPPASKLSVLSRRKKILFVLAALSLSLLLALLAGELIVRLAAPQDLSGTWREDTPRGYKRNKAGGTARHQLGQRIVHYRFNGHHLRGGPIGTAKTRVLVLGDSFTFGWLLDEPDTYVAKFGQAADGRFGDGAVEFLNGAAGGWGTADYLAFLEDEGDSIKPSVVLAFLGVDDTRRAAKSQLYRLIDPAALVVEPTNYTAPSAGLKGLVNSVPGYEFLLEHSHLLQLIRRTSLRHQLTKSEPPAAAAAAPATQLVIASDDSTILKEKAMFCRLNNWCRQRKVTLLVATNWPAEQRFAPVPIEINIAFRSQAADFFGQEQIDFFDAGPQLAAEMGNQRDRYLIPGDGHPNEAGAALIAKVVWPWLESRLSAESLASY